MIYLITSRDEKFMKFGFTENQEKRFSNYKTHNPNFLIVGLIEGNKEEEKDLHENNKHLLINNTEWMQFNENLYYSFVNNKTFRRYPFVEENKFIYVLPNFTSLLKTISEFKLLYCLFEKSEFYNSKCKYIGNMVIINKRVKNELSVTLNLSNKTINNIITSLVKKKVIFRDATNVYYLNPMYFFRGKISDRTKCVKLIQEYKIV